MIRKAIRAVTFLVAALAIPAAMLVAPVPAGAVDANFDTSIRETFGHRWCIGSDTTDLFAAVVERTCPGRKWDEVSLGNSQWLIELHSDPTKCIAANNAETKVVLHPCSGGFGVVWIRERSSAGHDLWLNRVSNLYLSGPDGSSPGGQFFLDFRNGTAGELQQFDNVPG